jgi:hypothetical protein
MYAFCLVLSVIAAAFGLFALGFGLSPYQGSLGNALLEAGAVGVVGGMIMFGLAAVVSQLRRIAEALGPRPAAAVARRPATSEAVDAPPPPGPGPVQRQAAGARAPFPPRPGPDQRAPVAPPPPPLAEAPEAPTLVERQRPSIIEEEVPLAPSRVPAGHMGRGGPPSAEPAPEPLRSPEPRHPESRPTQADILARLSNLAATPPRPMQRPEPQRAPPPPPPPPPVERAAPVEQRRSNMFDALWPAEVRAARQSQSETIARVPRPEPRPDMRLDLRNDAKPEPRVDIRPEPRSEQRPEPRPEPRGEPRSDPRFEPPAARERNEPAINGSGREPMMPPPAEHRPIAILKSGVIDGMAYTLYTDGSIEAELPQGTMRFASIDDLRSHLEKADRQA